ncbi:hypothetical protein O7623_21785 [Solwaraspora sp. WMMD791]|uniref:hypothetical protein n=1 Tax=Solwaraspora sp. WMMD791 TaxID=3016086 RepID=UPI002499ECEF|nr:hypothetical protein [Solwaraspora sp. WMMD791]WFE25975.1 hypothetical protein O7623_21785 [Solwaraspora sp. WMMD791]
MQHQEVIKACMPVDQNYPGKAKCTSTNINVASRDLVGSGVLLRLAWKVDRVRGLKLVIFLP